MLMGLVGRSGESSIRDASSRRGVRHLLEDRHGEVVARYNFGGAF